MKVGGSDLLALAILATMTAAGSARAQSLPVVRIAAVESEKECHLYEVTDGASATVVTRRAMATVTSWRSWLVRDCVDNFSGLRAALEAALASSGKVAVGPQGDSYALTVRISDVTGGGGPAPEPGGDARGFGFSSSQMAVTTSFSLRDRAGRTVSGDVFTKQIETAYRGQVGGLEMSSSESGRGLYARLQEDVAMAVARKVAFAIEPARVVAVDGNRVRVSYGYPLLKLGTVLQVTDTDGFAPSRYLVISSNQGSAIAELDGDRGAEARPGDLVTVLEPENAAANGRRYRRVDLP